MLLLLRWPNRSMWLCPFCDTNLGGQPNTLYVLMDEPISIGCVKIWNYSRTPSRGAKEIEVSPHDIPIDAVDAIPLNAT